MKTVADLPEVVLRIRGVPAGVVEQAMRLLPNAMADRAATPADDSQGVGGKRADASSSSRLTVDPAVSAAELASRIALAIVSQIPPTPVSRR